MAYDSFNRRKIDFLISLIERTDQVRNEYGTLRTEKNFILFYNNMNDLTAYLI